MEPCGSSLKICTVISSIDRFLRVPPVNFIDSESLFVKTKRHYR